MPHSVLSSRDLIVTPRGRDEDGWTISEAIGGTCVSFPSRNDARAYAAFARAYVDHWGYINLASAPLALSDHPVAFTAEHVPEDQLAEVRARLHDQLYQPLQQTDGWNSEGRRSAYSPEHCCHCGWVQRTVVHQVMVTRTHGGEWWVVRPSAPPLPEEGMELINRGSTRERIALPIGGICLRKHPEYRIGLIAPRRTNG